LTVGAARLLYKNGRSSTIGDAGRWACAAAAFAPVIGLTAAQGGYFPTSWGWASVPLLWATAIGLVVRTELRVSNAELLFAGALVAFSAWVALSIAWSSVPAESVLELERTLVYVAGVAAVLVFSREGDASLILASVLGAIALIALFSLATRLFPDRVGVYDRTAVYRLAQPVGYWNGLALLVAMGSLLAFVFAARATSIPARGVCAAILVFLLPTLYFTFGRAAWIALLGGALAGVAVDRRRLQLLAALVVLGTAPVLAVWAASGERGLTHAGTSLERAAHDGHRLALLLVILAAANATATAAFAWGERQIQIGDLGRRVVAGALVLAALGLVFTVFGRYGGPVELAKRGYSAFTAPPPHVSNLNRRLLSFSGNGRADVWRVAWHQARRHPVLGGGAGAYERYFLRHQPANIGRVRDAHGLYIETLAELGPFGLILLLTALGIPVAVLVAARGHPLIAGAFGAYVAFLIHAGVDWDWELSGVTLAGLLCGTTILIAARESARVRQLSVRARWLGVGAAIVTALFAGIGLLGNAALSRSESAREHGDLARGASAARSARFWMPWSPAPWAALGRAELAAGLVRESRQSFRKAISLDRGDWQLWYELAGASTGPARRRALLRATALFPRSQLVSRARREAGAPK
jgi:O-antigen ligase/polysaccharide polymerase Wzy-like membrane protein